MLTCLKNLVDNANGGVFTLWQHGAMCGIRVESVMTVTIHQKALNKLQSIANVGTLHLVTIFPLVVQTLITPHEICQGSWASVGYVPTFENCSV